MYKIILTEEFGQGYGKTRTIERDLMILKRSYKYKIENLFFIIHTRTYIHTTTQNLSLGSILWTGSIKTGVDCMIFTSITLFSTHRFCLQWVVNVVLVDPSILHVYRIRVDPDLIVENFFLDIRRKVLSIRVKEFV